MGEKRTVGYTEAGDAISMRLQRADAKKALGSVQKMNLGGNVLVLDGNRSLMQNKETVPKTRVEYEGGQYVTCLWAPSDLRIKSEEENHVEGQDVRDLGD